MVSFILVRASACLPFGLSVAWWEVSMTQRYMWSEAWWLEPSWRHEGSNIWSPHDSMGAPICGALMTARYEIFPIRGVLIYFFIFLLDYIFVVYHASPPLTLLPTTTKHKQEWSTAGTYSYCHFFTCSLVNLFICSLVHLFICSLVHLFTCFLAHLFTYQL